MKRYAIYTFGCQMNVHDSRRIAETLRAHGYGVTDKPEEAQVLLFNTCSVRQKAEHKLVSAVGRFQSLKKRRPDLIIAVAGCMAQQYGEALLRQLKIVDILIGPDNIPELPDLLRQAERGRTPVARTVLDLEEPRFLSARLDLQTPGVASYITVAKGCSERCGFCVVPQTRGPERCRPSDHIIAEARQLVASGVRQVTLLGQTVNAWAEPDPADSRGRRRAGFAHLLRRIAREVPELLRLRYTSPHPRHVSPGLLTAHADLDVLAEHIHLPVQSGSDRVLRRMGRRHTRATFVKTAHALQATRPGLTLSTDLIVAFPGETEEDFQQTLSLVGEVGFVSAFGFKYSPRPGTPAAKLAGAVPAEVAEERLARLFDMIQAQQSKHLTHLVGRRTKVLIEGRNAKDPSRFSGRSDRNEIVHVKVPPEHNPTGQLLEVLIEQANNHSLMGSMHTAGDISSNSRCYGALDDLGDVSGAYGGPRHVVQGHSSRGAGTRGAGDCARAHARACVRAVRSTPNAYSALRDTGPPPRRGSGMRP